MKSTSNSKSTSVGKNGKKASAEKPGASRENLQKLFEDGLKDIYWAEKALVKALPKMIKNATDETLVEALENHLGETEGQVTRLEDVFTSIDLKAVAKKCDAMEGLIKEAQGIMEESEDGVMMDAGIISSGQKVEHYEIATYGTLAAFADILGHSEAADLLRQTLEEEKAADEKLTEVTPGAVMVADEEEEAEA